jgi:outer membrane protein TolC
MSHWFTSRLLGTGVMFAGLAIGGCAMVSPPVTGPQVAGFSAHLIGELEAAPEPLAGLLTADDAVTRAVRFNRTIRAKELEAALAAAKVVSQSGAMLPNIVAESTYYRRDLPALSHSNLSPVYSTSTDLHDVSRSITLSWNILDFGLSYVRAKQGLDKALQQREDARRVTARIVEETRAIYWRAVALQQLGPALFLLDPEIDEAILLSLEAAADKRLDPLVSINYQHDLLNAQRELNGLQTSLAGATDQLKQSIGLPLIDRFALEPIRTGASPHLPIRSPSADVTEALRQRPEIRQSMYDLRMTSEDVNAAVLQLLPGITINSAFNNDSNSYLLHSNWISWGTKIAGNLIGLARLPADLETIEAQEQVHRENALAIAATIAMQVHVARARLAVQARAYRDAERFAGVQRQLLHQVKTSVRLEKVGQQALVREKLATLLADVRATVAFADLQAAVAAYATARGDDVVIIEAAPDEHQLDDPRHAKSAWWTAVTASAER